MIVQQPRPETDDEREVRLSRFDAKNFLTLLASEIDYLEQTIPTVDAMTAAQVRILVKRLSQENLRILRALRVLLNHL